MTAARRALRWVPDALGTAHAVIRGRARCGAFIDERLSRPERTRCIACSRVLGLIV